MSKKKSAYPACPTKDQIDKRNKSIALGIEKIAVSGIAAAEALRNFAAASGKLKQIKNAAREQFANSTPITPPPA